MIKVALVRGKYLNNFEGQNYIFDQQKIRLTGIGSLRPLHSKLPFPIKRFPSLSDVGDYGPEIWKKGLRYIANRTIGDSQNLWGLETMASQFDIFHTADPHYYYSFQLAKMRADNRINRLVCTSWDTIAFNNESVEKKRSIKYYVLDRVDKFICYTQKAKQVLIKEGVEENKILVVRLGVDLKKFKIQSSRDDTKKQLTILFVGRLVAEKGIMDMYEYFKKNNKGILRIVGNGPLKKDILHKIKTDRLQHKVMVETTSYDQMPSIYQSSDILVAPSKHTNTWEEQYGMVLVEALASGLPIVTYDSGAINEIVGDCALVAKEGDQNELYSSINRLIKSKSLRLKLGTMGRGRAQDFFDSRKTASKISNIYQSLIQR